MTDPTALPAFAPPVSAELAHPVRDSVFEALAAEGFRPEVDEDGDIVARMSGQPMFLRCFETSPTMIRVWSQWLLDDQVPGDELTHLRAANAMTGVMNLVKCTLLDDRLVVAVDLTVHEAMDLRALLTATMEAVRDGVTTWHGAVLQLLDVPSTS